MMSINDFLAFLNDKNLDNISEQTFMDVIDEELQKDENQMDTDLIEFCLLQLEKIQKEQSELSVAEEKKKTASSAELNVLQNNEKKPTTKTRRVALKTGITAAAIIIFMIFSQTVAYADMIGYFKTESYTFYKGAYRIFYQGRDSEAFLSELNENGFEDLIFPEFIYSDDFITKEKISYFGDVDVCVSVAVRFFYLGMTGTITIDDNKFEEFTRYGDYRNLSSDVEILDVNGYEVYCFTQNGDATIVYFNGMTMYMISITDCSLNKALIIAQTIKTPEQYEKEIMSKYE